MFVYDAVYICVSSNKKLLVFVFRVALYKFNNAPAKIRFITLIIDTWIYTFITIRTSILYLQLFNPLKRNYSFQ